MQLSCSKENLPNCLGGGGLGGLGGLGGGVEQAWHYFSLRYQIRAVWRCKELIFEGIYIRPMQPLVFLHKGEIPGLLICIFKYPGVKKKLKYLFWLNDMLIHPSTHKEMSNTFPSSSLLTWCKGLQNAAYGTASGARLKRLEWVCKRTRRLKVCVK